MDLGITGITVFLVPTIVYLILDIAKRINLQRFRRDVRDSHIDPRTIEPIDDGRLNRESGPDLSPVVKREIILWRDKEAIRSIMQVIVSTLFILVAIYIILSKQYGTDTEKWAFATVGLVIGFWLKS